MSYVGYSDVANQANTTDGFASKVNANNVPGDTTFGNDVGAGGVVDLYGGSPSPTVSYILMESSGYVLQETGDKIYLESV